MLIATENWLTVEEIATRLQVHIETVRRWIRSGELQGLSLGRRAGHRVKEADLDGFLERRQYRREP